MRLLSLWGVVLRLTMRSRCGTEGESKEHACLGLQKPLLWRRSATTSLHRERSSARGEGYVGPVQGRRECGDVR